MKKEQTDVTQRIKREIEKLAEALGQDASELREDASILQTGLLDSASLMMLIVWFETEFDVSTEEEELTVDNFGTIALMADYLDRNG